YLDTMGQSLKYIKVHVQMLPMCIKIGSYLKIALKKSGEAFKEGIMLKIEGNNENKFVYIVKRY
ncbi:16491_t:CDS:2, partial [Funneliformis caledonium]